MNSEDYTNFMNYISIINKRYNTLRFGVVTNGIKVNDIIYINYPKDDFIDPFVITGITTILNTDPAIDNLNDGSLYVAGGVNINKNIYIENDIVNKENSQSTSYNIKTNRIEIEQDFYSNNNYFETLRCSNIDLNGFENNSIIINNMFIKSIAELSLDSNTGNILNEKFYIKDLIVYENSYIDIMGDNSVKNIYGSLDIISNVNCSNLYTQYINCNNLIINNNMLVKKNIVTTDAYIKGIFKFNKSSSYGIINNYYLSGKLIQKNSIDTYSGNTSFDSNLFVKNIISNNDIFCNRLYVRFKVDTDIKTVPLCINQSQLQITTFSFFVQAIKNYCSFIVSNDIIFENPTNSFSTLTYYFNIYSSDLIACVPKLGFYILVGGFRSSVYNTYFVIYKINFFDYDTSQINITIFYDSNNELNFILGYVYTIFKFNCNYLI